MQFPDFSIHAEPFISKAYCKKCHGSCQQVSNGWFSACLFCPTCEIVYELKMVKVPEKKVSEEFLAQAREEVERKKKRRKEKKG
jgi:hypothetical protein